MCAGPAYHAAPLAFDVRSPSSPPGRNPLRVSRQVGQLRGVLAAIERHRVTRCHLVPIMFQRLLALPDEVKAKYDSSSLVAAIHGAAA